MALELLLASQVIGKALGRWMGETQAPSLVNLAKRIEAARQAVATAENLLEEADSLEDPAQRQAQIDSANTLVGIARAMVTDGAQKAAVAIPTAVLESFEEWDASLVKVGTVLVEEARSAVVTMFGIGVAGVVIYALLRKVL